MDQLQITSTEVQQYGNQMKSLTGEVHSLLQQTHTRMMNMSGVWDSPASRSLIEQFNSCRPVFDQYVEALQQYSLYLTQTAQQYQENESMLQQGMR